MLRPRCVLSRSRRYFKSSGHPPSRAGAESTERHTSLGVTPGTRARLVTHASDPQMTGGSCTLFPTQDKKRRDKRSKDKDDGEKPKKKKGTDESDEEKAKARFDAPLCKIPSFSRPARHQHSRIADRSLSLSEVPRQIVYRVSSTPLLRPGTGQAQEEEGQGRRLGGRRHRGALGLELFCRPENGSGCSGLQPGGRESRAVQATRAVLLTSAR